MSLCGWFRKQLTLDVPSPSDIVASDGVTYWQTENKVEISLGKLNIPFTKPPKVWIPPVPDTNSMDPSFDFGHNNILVAGADEENQKILIDFVKVGDIVVYQIPTKIYAIHRVVKIETDSIGRKFTLRGDNNPANDPYPARDENIQWLAIGTIF